MTLLLIPNGLQSYGPTGCDLSSGMGRVSRSSKGYHQSQLCLLSNFQRDDLEICEELTDEQLNTSKNWLCHVSFKRSKSSSMLVMSSHHIEN